MKNAFLISAFLVSTSLFAQVTQWSKIIVDPKSSFRITNEDKPFNSMLDPSVSKEIVRARLIVNMDTLRCIKSTRSVLRGDTLKIVIFQTDPAYHHEYRITIIRNKYQVEYNFLTSGDQLERKIVCQKSKLLLSGMNFVKGSELRGYTEFTGNCTSGCWEEKILIKGNFKTTIE